MRRTELHVLRSAHRLERRGHWVQSTGRTRIIVPFRQQESVVQQMRPTVTPDTPGNDT